MQRPTIRLTRDEEIACRRWTCGVLGVVTTLTVLILTLPAFRNAPPDPSASACADEAIARPAETTGQAERRPTPHAPTAGCDPRVAIR
jgi:hypothetical protein